MADIGARARFDDIRYAQLWEDADVLLPALGAKPGATLVSICSAGDNALAMLTLDPAKVVVLDLSPAQIRCLALRLAAIRRLDHDAFLELMGSRPSPRRAALFGEVLASLDDEARRFWAPRAPEVAAHGLGGIGKFERYFRLFRTYVLPLVHGRATVAAVLQSRPRPERARFLDERWNSWRWRLLLKLFFSRSAMGALGRDPAFFDHVEGSVADHVARRIVHAAVELDPAENPFLHWILTGTHGLALPLPWRAEHYPVIRARLDRIEVHQVPVERYLAGAAKADGFNLSDIFEYMDEASFTAVYGAIVAAANPGARLVYWNMMVPRRRPQAFADRVRQVAEAEQAGKIADKAFFYSDFVVEEIV